MPIFDYKCQNCESKYEIFHLVKEKKEDIICPDCGSAEATKLLSPFSALTSHSHSHSPIPDCASDRCGFNPSIGGCPNGMCGLN